MEKQFRYPGTRPFQENDRNLFFGRNTDIKNLSELIVLEKMVVLFSKSGYGKSSLLNAGVIPRLTEKEKFQVLNIRLNEQAKNPVDLVRHHLSKKAESNKFLSSKFNIPAELPNDPAAILWYYAKSIQFADKTTKALVLVFDQFEELSNFSNSEIADFASTLATLLNLNLPESVRVLLRKKLEAGKGYFTEKETDQLLEPLNLKVVFSLRNDRISLLNKLKGSLPAIFKKTYELQPLDEFQALEALLEPAEELGDFASPEFTYSEDAIALILNSLKDQENQRIETFQLQLICQHAEELIIEKAGTNTKRLELSAAELGNPEDIFENHYNTIIGSLPSESQHKARILIEDKLIIGGNRVPLPESVIIEEHQISADLLKTLVDKRLLRSEPNTVGGLSFELSHDTLVAPIQKTAKIRRLQEAYERAEKDQLEKARIQRKLRRTRILLGTSVFALVLAVFASLYAYRQKKSTELALIKVEESQAATNSALVSEQNATKAAKEAQKNTDEALKKAVESEKVTIRALAEARKAQLTTKRALERAKEAQDSTYLALNKAEEANSQFQKQAATSKALILAYEVKGLLEEGKDLLALRTAESAYKTARNAGTLSSTIFSQSISNAFYNSESLQISYFDGHQDFISSVAFDSFGNFILTGSFDKTAILWDLKGNLIQKFEGHEGAVTSVAFSPDGNFVLTGSYDGTAMLWDKSGKMVRKFEGHDDAVTSVAFSPDGKSLITGSFDGFAALWDINGDPIQIFEGHQYEVSSVAFYPDGNSVLTGSSDGTAILWDLNGSLLQIFEGNQDEVTSVAFSPNGKSLVTVSSDGTAILWDINGKQIQKFEEDMDMATSVAFSPDGNSLLFGTYVNALLFNLKGNLIQRFGGLYDAAFSVAFSPDGNSVLTGGINAANLWDTKTKPIQNFEKHQKAVTSIAFSPSGNSVLTGSLDHAAILWDTLGIAIQIFEGHENPVLGVAYSPGGNSILTGSEDSTAILWDIEGNQIQKFTGHHKAVYSVAFSPNGNSVLTGSEDSTAIVWDLKGNPTQTFEGHHGIVTSVAFSPDGNSILTGSVDSTAILWDLKGNQIQKFKGHRGAVFSVAFSSSGDSVLTGSEDKTSILWGSKGNPIHIFKGHMEAVNSVTFSADGKFVLTGGGDKKRMDDEEMYYEEIVPNAILWDINGRIIQKFENFGDVSSVAFSPNGNLILTGRKDNTAKLLKTPQGIYEWLQSPDCPLRQLTEEEKVRYGIIEGED